MKIRHPWLIKTLAWCAARLIRIWIRTLRYHVHFLGEDVTPSRPGLVQRYIYIFWHENMLVPAYHYARPDIHVLISEHADGRLIAEACRHLGFSVVHGSTTRGGIRAMKQMVQISRTEHLAITPDGSRLIYVGDQSTQIFVRALDALAPVPVFKGEGIHGLFVSPDGRWIGFYDGLSVLKKVAVGGGAGGAKATAVLRCDQGFRAADARFPGRPRAPGVAARSRRG